MAVYIELQRHIFHEIQKQDDNFVFPSMYNYGHFYLLGFFFYFFNDFLSFFCSFWFLLFKYVHSIVLRDSLPTYKVV